MSNQDSNQKELMIERISQINKVEGFDPTPFALELTDLNTMKVRTIIPVSVQIAWFKLKYPDGKIAVSVQSLRSDDRYIASAKIYAHYKDAVECYLAEGSAIKGKNPDNPDISAIEWAQTTAIGVALRNAGFGLQFAVSNNEQVSGENAGEMVIPEKKTKPIKEEVPEDKSATITEPETKKEPTLEERVQKAMELPCPMAKYKGMTLGDLLREDPKALDYMARKYQGDENAVEAAKLICEFALQMQKSA